MKARVVVNVMLDFEFVLEGSDVDAVRESAKALGIQNLLGDRLLKERLDARTIVLEPVVSEVSEVSEEARTSTYTCAHCARAQFKEAWGPGRVRCPHCHKLAPSASEMS